LAACVRAGDAGHTPWPFRVDARTGRVINGEEYGGMIVAPVRLFAELILIKEGDAAKYARAQNAAWDWIMKYPMHNDRWSGYFEDVGRDTENVNQAIPTMTAYYILTRPDPAAVDPHWTGDVGHMLDWVRRSLAETSSCAFAATQGETFACRLLLRFCRIAALGGLGIKFERSLRKYTTRSGAIGGRIRVSRRSLTPVEGIAR
jgi:hypothetical protein